MFSNVMKWRAQVKRDGGKKSITKTWGQTSTVPGEGCKEGPKCLSAATHLAPPPPMRQAGKQCGTSPCSEPCQQSTPDQTSTPLEVSQEHGRESEFSTPMKDHGSSLREAYKKLGLVVVKRGWHTRRQIQKSSRSHVFSMDAMIYHHAI